MCANSKGKIFISTLSRKVDRLFKENAQLRKISGAVAQMDIRHWEQRNADIALYETRELESQRLELYQANQWADQDQAQREKIHLCGELGMRNRIFQERRARDCQEIEDLRRICCEETDRARQLRKLMTCLCNRKRTLLQWISSWLKFGIYRTRPIPWPTQENFNDPETASSSGASHVPSQPSSILQETFLKAYLLEKDHPQLSSRIHRIWHHLLADWDRVIQEILRNMEEGRDESRRVRQSQRHVLIKLSQLWTHCITLEELVLTMVWWITQDFHSRKCILADSGLPHDARNIVELQETFLNDYLLEKDKLYSL